MLEERIYKELQKIVIGIADEIRNDPKVREEREKIVKELGTLTSEDLQKRMTI